MPKRCQHPRSTEIMGNEKGSENNEDITVAWDTTKKDMGMAKNREVVFYSVTHCHVTVAKRMIDRQT